VRLQPRCVTKEWSALVCDEVLGAVYWWFTWWSRPRASWFGGYDCARGLLRYGFRFRIFRGLDGVNCSDWGVPRLMDHLNDLYVLYIVMNQIMIMAKGILRKLLCSLYSVLMHEEGNWGLDLNGSAEVRTAPNEIVGFEIVEV
jgi:hypothetical protein